MTRAEVPILCSMVAVLRGRQSPKSSSCGQSGPGGGKIMEEEGPERKEGREEQRKNPVARLAQVISHSLNQSLLNTILFLVSHTVRWEQRRPRLED